MIIKRKYATYGQLTADKKSKEVITNVFKGHNLSAELCDGILDPFNTLIVMNTDMESGIPGQVFQELCCKLDELDKLYPFDNGFTYNDVDYVYKFPSRKGSAIMQFLVNKPADSFPLIVQVIAYEYRNGETVFIEPWDMGHVFFD